MPKSGAEHYKEAIGENGEKGKREREKVEKVAPT
jgi:hypothetical protein